MWLVRFIRHIYPTRFRVAQATRLPVVGPILSRWLFDGDQMVYLAKNSVIPVHHPIDVPDDVVLPSRVVDHFIEQAGTHWLMDNCLCRQAEGCEDYPIDLGCLFLGEAAQEINPRLGRRVTKEEALAHVQRCQEAGLVHLIGRNKLDTMWLGVGPGEKLLTICHCCPCCCLYGVLPNLAEHLQTKVTRMPGVRVKVSERCVGCGSCAQDVCFVDAIKLVDGRAVIDAGCVGCGRCVEHCPTGAIVLEVEDDRFVQETVRRIAPLVDVS
jgi:formate hydrogenlyase subunit 6/NADH:ubiquinone oxidoreductase subunit I